MQSISGGDRRLNDGVAMPSADDGGPAKMFASAMPIVFCMSLVSSVAPPLSPNLSVIFDWLCARISFVLAILSYVTDVAANQLKGENSFAASSSFSKQYSYPSFSSSAYTAKPSHAASIEECTGQITEVGSVSDASEAEVLKRMLARVICGALELPSSSPKLGFMRSLVDEMLADSEANKNLEVQDSSRAVLAECFLLNADRLAKLLARSRPQSLSFQKVIDQVSRGPVAALTLAASTGLRYARSRTLAPPPSSALEATLASMEHADKISGDLVWLSDKLQLYGGLHLIAAPWSEASQLSWSAAYNAPPRVQSSMISVVIRILSSVSSDITVCSRSQRVLLLLHWLPLLCVAYHGGDGPLMSSAQKQVCSSARMHQFRCHSLASGFSNCAHEPSPFALTQRR